MIFSLQLLVNPIFPSTIRKLHDYVVRYGLYIEQKCARAKKQVPVPRGKKIPSGQIDLAGKKMFNDPDLNHTQFTMMRISIKKAFKK